MRKSSKYGDDETVGSCEANPFSQLGRKRSSFRSKPPKTCDAAFLVQAALRVQQGQVKEQPLNGRQFAIRTCIEPFHAKLDCSFVEREGFPGAAKYISRELIEKDYQGEPSAGRVFPTREFVARSLPDCGAELLGYDPVEFRVGFEPTGKIDGESVGIVVGFAKPEVQDILGPGHSPVHVSLYL